MLDERKSAILQALVEGHIRTGAPVSSRAILDASGLAVSSATIRNELVKLEREDYVEQPHTSAGRLPTDKAYRYYVDHISPRQLRTSVRAKIEEFFTSVHHGLSQLFQDTSDLLADITHYPAIVLGPGLASDRVHGIHLVQLGPELVVVVVVTDSGRVAKELVRLGRATTPSQLRAAESMLAGAYEGQAVNEVPDVADAVPGPVGELVSAAREVVKRSETAVRDMYLGGTSQLTSLWEDLRKVHTMLEFLERESIIHQLLVDAEQGTSVRIGSELSLAPDADLAIVSTTYGAGDVAHGRVGVLGPRRMDYRRTIKVVEEVSEGLGDSLGT